MKATLTAALVLTLAACRTGAGDVDESYACETIADCYRGEVCAVGECVDLGCRAGADVCCERVTGGVECERWFWSDSGDFHPMTSVFHPGISVDEAYALETDGDPCRFERCEPSWDRQI